MATLIALKLSVVEPSVTTEDVSAPGSDDFNLVSLQVSKVDGVESFLVGWFCLAQESTYQQLPGQHTFKKIRRKEVQPLRLTWFKSPPPLPAQW